MGRWWGSSWDMLRYVSKQGLWKFWKTLKQVAWKRIWFFPCLSKPRNFLDLSTSSHLKFSNPNFLMANVFFFFSRGKQCPKHWQADRFKGIVQKLWVGSDWPNRDGKTSVREISTFVGWRGVSLFPGKAQWFLERSFWMFAKVVFCCWILKMIRSYVWSLYICIFHVISSSIMF